MTLCKSDVAGDGRRGDRFWSNAVSGRQPTRLSSKHGLHGLAGVGGGHAIDKHNMKADIWRVG